MTIPSEPICEQALAEAIEFFERASGRNFAQADDPSERTYDGIENIGKRIVIAIDDCYDISSITVGETELTSDQYRILPKLVGLALPVEAIEFLTCVPRGKDVLTISAKFGWPITPASVTSAILKLAVVRIPRPASSSETAGPVQSRKIGDRSITYASSSNGSTGFQSAQGAETEALRVAQGFRRVPYA